MTAFGVNAIVLPPGYDTGRHFHDQQEELYFCHSGRIEIEFGDGTAHPLDPGPPRGWTPRRSARIRNVGDEDAVYLVVGGKDGYVGRDGSRPRARPRGAGSDGARRSAVAFRGDAR